MKTTLLQQQLIARPRRFPGSGFSSDRTAAVNLRLAQMAEERRFLSSLGLLKPPRPGLVKQS